MTEEEKNEVRKLMTHGAKLCLGVIKKARNLALDQNEINPADAQYTVMVSVFSYLSSAICEQVKRNNMGGDASLAKTEEFLKGLVDTAIRKTKGGVENERHQ